MLNAQSASKNGEIPHINRSIYSIEALNSQVFFTVIHSSVLYILLKKSKNDGAIYMKKHAIYG